MQKIGNDITLEWPQILPFQFQLNLFQFHGNLLVYCWTISTEKVTLRFVCLPIHNELHTEGISGLGGEIPLFATMQSTHFFMFGSAHSVPVPDWNHGEIPCVII